MEFWFDFASTYSYLSVMRVDEMTVEAGVSVIWRPFLLGPIFASQGWAPSPFNLYPAKGAYMWADMTRLAAARGLPLVTPDPFPQNSLTAARVAIAVLDKPEGKAFCRAVYAAEFARGQSISDLEVLRTCLTEVGLAADYVAEAQNPEIKGRLKAQTEAAMDRQIFGAPSFTVENQLFWGDDRLEMAIAAASG